MRKFHTLHDRNTQYSWYFGTNANSLPKSTTSTYFYFVASVLLPLVCSTGSRLPLYSKNFPTSYKLRRCKIERGKPNKQKFPFFFSFFCSTSSLFILIAKDFSFLLLFPRSYFIIFVCKMHLIFNKGCTFLGIPT